MDKGQKQQRVPQNKGETKTKPPNATSKVTSSKTKPTTPTAGASAQQQRSKSWAPHTKINKFLSNIERSFMNQFSSSNGSSAGGSSGSSGGSNSSSSSSSLIKTKSRLNAASIGPPSSLDTCGAGATSSQQQQQQQTTKHEKCNNNTNNNNNTQNGSTTKGQTSAPQMKGEPRAVKTTLNKYQQQIVSTMRPNHQLLLNTNTNNASVTNNKLNNKLSIPPPHANDEARNQNHRIIFGAAAMLPPPPPSSTSSSSQPIKQLSDSNVILSTSSATLRPSPPQSSGGARQQARNLLVDNRKQQQQQSETQLMNTAAELACHANTASPASSAKSLPTVPIKPIGSQTLHSRSTLINEDEDSGFSTYQSRRSLDASNCSAVNQLARAAAASSSTAAPQTTTKSDDNRLQQTNPNMILMQTHTQLPIGAFHLNNSPQQQQQHQFNYNYHLPYPTLKHNPFQHPNLNAQQIFANNNNQVPITSTTITAAIDPSNLDCYPNPNHHHLLHHHNISNTQQQRLSQSQMSDQHLHNSNQNTLFTQAALQQFYGLYGPPNPGMQLPVPQNSEIGQEIYANAPPKPRRYQYYDPTNSAHLFPQMITSVTAAPSLNMTNNNSNISMANGNTSNNTFRQQQQQFFNRQNYPQANQQQQQLLSNQPMFNMSFLRMPNLYPAQQQQLQSLPIQQQITYNNNNFQEQQKSTNLPYTLTKSKSSLDAADLMQYKLDSQQRSNTLRLPHHKQQQQQTRQPIYGTQLDNTTNYLSTLQGQRQATLYSGNNLHRSKSVSHLLQPDYDRQQVNHYQRDAFIDYGQATSVPKFLSVSSASTANLNMIGLANNQQNQLNKVPSQMSMSHNQQNYHDLVQQQGNLLFSSATQRQHQQRSNNWHQMNQVSANCIESNNKLQQQQQRPSDRANVTKLNSAFSSCGKVVRQSQGLGDSEDGFGKPSLDDKIRCLMIEEDKTSNAINVSNLMVKNSGQNDNNVICRQSSDNTNSSQASWPVKQQPPLPALTSDKGTSILKHESNTRQSTQNYTQKVTHNQNADDPELTNRIYINEASTKMGNRQQRQYQVNDRSQAESIQTTSSRSQESDGRIRSTANSQLIVDLTTPRVLAKTQTTLSSSDIHADATQRKDSCSINQVGLPQRPSNSLVNNSGPEQISTSMLDSRASFRQFTMMKNSNESQNKSELCNMNNSVNNVQKSTICERTAPYYYSDLKSDEQRQALLNIVQQKSLSPPPQLLSRSNDQNNTRLSIKSATLHPSHMRMLSESIASDQRQNGNNQKLNYDSMTNDFNSTSNIAKNIDKLFESPTRSKINAVQSMLALNDQVADISQASLSSFQIGSESTSIGYFSGDMKNKNFSKSKSLENINQGSKGDIVTCGTTVAKSGNPVYENIRRSDKLMSAINNSTTCLSTSASRSKRDNNYIVENLNMNSEESTDSILGSSLDESDSSLDLIDEIKLSPTDNHLSDISQLIEQLKINHSKLADEYKSTLVRITRTMNAKNKPANGDYRNDKLSRRLQLLELKSKKCESRGKNQLALIHMMEKVLRQSEAKSTDTSTEKIESPNSQNQPFTSPLLAFDFHNVKQPVSMTGSIQAHRSPTSSNSPSTLNSQHSLMSDTVGNSLDHSSESRRSNQSIVKAIVTETEGQKSSISKVKRADDCMGPVSLSTRHHQQNLQGSGAKNNMVSKRGECNEDKPLSVVEREKQQIDKNTNPFEDEDSTSLSESSIEEVSNINKLSEANENQKSSNSRISKNMDLDEEDFIEFLTTDASNHRSQFEASQFSASDFDNQAANQDSRSNNSLKQSHLTQNHSFSNSMTTGILKGAKNGPNCLNNNNNSNINGNNNNINGFDDLRENPDRNKFNNVLGNVIDVDICPLNNLSQDSPVNNQASCLN